MEREGTFKWQKEGLGLWKCLVLVGLAEGQAPGKRLESVWTFPCASVSSSMKWDQPTLLGAEITG